MTLPLYLSQAQQAEQSGDLAQAESIYQKILFDDSSHWEALHGLGLLSLKQEDLDRATACFSKILAQHPHHADTLNNRAIAHFQQGAVSLAQQDWEMAIRVQPETARYWFNLGRCFQSYETLSTHHQAQKCFQKAVAFQTDYAQAWNSLGNIFSECGKPKKALHAYQKSLNYQPKDLNTKVNLAVNYVEIHKPRIARRVLSEIIEEAPHFARAAYNLGLLEMQAGEYRVGLDRYETYRWVDNHFIRPTGNLSRPLWSGEKVSSVLVCHEQGFGDSLQFVRYLQQASQLTQHLYLEVPQTLVQLMKHLCLDLACPLTVIAEGDPLPETPVWAPMLRLLYLFSDRLFSAPNNSPYFQVEALKMPESKSLRIGVVWATGYRPAPKLLKLYYRKSVDPQCIEGLIKKYPAIAFYNFQVGQENQGTPKGLLPLPNLLGNFYETARQLKAMDLVITVDTAVAHLAGALDLPTWVLVPTVADWRWGFEETYSHWYSQKMRIFRQKPEDLAWSGAFEEIGLALAAFQNA